MNKKIINIAFTMADRRSSWFHISNIQRKAVAFTMAEILLSLTIIGVVAAITLPSLTGNINERTWEAQRKALYARMSQAIALMGSLNGYGIGATDSETASNAARAFVTNGLAKVYKINNICNYNEMDKCGISSKLTKINGSKIDFPNRLAKLNASLSSFTINTYAVAFETANGESIAAFYNPLCTHLQAPTVAFNNSGISIGNYYDKIYLKMCANFVYDLNGKKGPNTLGKDIGIISAIYPTDSVVVATLAHAEVQKKSDGTYYYNIISASDTLHTCKLKGNNSRLYNFNEAIGVSANHDIFIKGVSFTIGNAYIWGHEANNYFYFNSYNGRAIVCNGAACDRGENAAVLCTLKQ